MEIDRNGLEVLEREECLRLLASFNFGRIAIHADALPTILPVNYISSDRGIVIRTGDGHKLQQATNHAVVAFEVDAIDPIYHTGWSVVVTGMARHLESGDDIEWAKGLALPHWTRGGNDQLICISTEIVSGRRFLTASQSGERTVGLNDRTELAR